jgi:hypothetical protein
LENLESLASIENIPLDMVRAETGSAMPAGFIEVVEDRWVLAGVFEGLAVVLLVEGEDGAIVCLTSKTSCVLHVKQL